MKRKRVLVALLLAALPLLALLVWPEPRLDVAACAPRRHYDVRILRDAWGVPHVFGKTDADVAYGLAWAHAEDDFPTIQGALLAARGRLASVFGRKAAPNDYMVALLRVRESVDARYDTDLAPATRALCEAYADGVNRYAALHPGSALVPLYPVRGKDVAAGFTHKLPLFFGLDRVLKQLLEPGTRPSPAPTEGSNTFAVAGRLSADGFTRLAVNSHQPWDGPVAWYEVHLHSEEGWDMVGGLFPGTPIVLHGHNRDLGWAHTVNQPDLVDVYDLETSPDHPGQYRFDGAWRSLESRDAAIDVKLFGPLHWTVHREVLWSVYGPVVRGPGGTFALRFANQGDIRAVEQWYRMNRAETQEQWLEAMRMGALPMMNCGYADRRGNILYLYNARLPLRAEGYDWRGHVPGNTSRTLWTEYLPFDRLPQVRNPRSGFVQSCNGSPFQTTLGPGNPDPRDYAPSLGIETRLTNRGLRALELFGGDASITREEFEAYKFDVAYSRTSAMAAQLERLLRARGGQANPLLREALGVVQSWDMRANPDNRRAALALLALDPKEDNDPADVPTAILAARLEKAARLLKQHYGRLDVPWREVNRLRRGGTDLGLGGAPDVLRAVYGEVGEDGRRVGRSGDSYILLVEWDPAGRVSSRSIHQYGSTQDAASRHYADQAPLFARCELKPVWMDEAEIRAHLEREYSPGQSN